MLTKTEKLQSINLLVEEMLDKILRRMHHFKKKRETVLPKLDNADKLLLSHDKFNI